MQIVISHRKQKTFNMFIIKYINSIIYIQRQIDKILKFIKIFIKIYIDDIVIEMKFLTKYLFNLRSLFQFFVKYNISILLNKIFLNYFNVNLLKRRVDSFELIIIKNKFEIIKIIKYSTTFKNLKYYLNLINYFRDYIYYFVQLI